MALLPTLGAHILQDMDVEGVTQELQSYSKASKERLETQAPSAPSETSSVDHSRAQDTDIRSDNGSVSVISSNDDVTTDLSASSTSWVSSMQSSQVSQASLEPAGNNNTTSTSPKSSEGADLSDSILTTSSMSSSVVPGPTNSSVSPLYSVQPVSQHFQASPNAHLESLSPATRSKAELWREVKMLSRCTPGLVECELILLQHLRGH